MIPTDETRVTRQTAVHLELRAIEEFSPPARKTIAIIGKNFGGGVSSAEISPMRLSKFLLA
jgi:hypothetical protein